MYSLVTIGSLSAATSKCMAYNNTYVNCSGQGLNSVPRNISLNVTHFILSHNNIKRLQVGDLENLTQLIEIDLSYNNISVIESFSFRGLVLLRIVRLTKNCITALNSSTFKGASKIEELYLDYNSLNQIPDLGRLPKLLCLDLSNNYVANAEFPPNYLSLLVLNKLMLNFNDMNSIDFQFLNCASIEILQLKQKKGSTMALRVTNHNFSSFSNIQKLYLSGNKFKQINLHLIFQSLHNAMSLTHLYLDEVMSGYHLSGDFFAEVASSLTYLSLKYSKQITLAYNAFLSLKKMIRLDLQMSSVTSIYTGFLNEVNSLQALNMEHIYVEEKCNLTCENFYSTTLSSLISLNLCSSPNIQIFQYDFRCLANLTHLSLCNNSLTSSNFAFLLPESLTYLNLSYNSISSTSNNLKRLLRLEILDLSSNFLCSPAIDIKWLSSLAALKELNLNNNSLTEWNIDFGFSAMRRFSLAQNKINKFEESFAAMWTQSITIDLRSNPFNCDCSMFWFRRWIDDPGKKVFLIGVDEYKCRPDTGKWRGHFLKKVLISELNRECDPQMPMVDKIIYVTVVMSITLIVAMLFIILYNKNSWYFRYYFYIYLYKDRTTGERRSLLEDGDYDFYMSYAEDNVDIAAQINDSIKHPDGNVHNRTVYRTYFETTDALGNEWEIERLSTKITSSHSVVVLLSPHYLRDKRRQFELHLIDNEMRHRHGKNANLHIILIFTTMTGEMIHRLPPTVRDIINNNKAIEWPNDGSSELQQREFWKTLRCRLVEMHL